MDDFVLYIYTSKYIYTPVISGSVTLTTQRAGAPGTLVFQVVKDAVISFHEGDRVSLRVSGKDLFYGFVFTKRRSSNGLITVTAYDQLRYFKNRETYSYCDLTASGLISRMAKDFSLSRGKLAETGYVIPARVESGKTLFDIAQTALDLTSEATGEMFVLYDDFGSLRLSRVGDMILDILLSGGSVGDFDYSSSIDSNTYTRIRLAREESGSGETVFYGAQNDALIKRWGVLQYYGKLDEDVSGSSLAKSLLSLYGKKTRNLKIVDAIGDTSVRAGVILPVSLDLGDMTLYDFLLAERVCHTFREGGHTMDLTLIGGEFVE